MVESMILSERSANQHPIPGMTGIAGYLAFFRDRMDGWSEENLLPD